ncbi:MAG: formylglycine-generating enzyme family protein [Tepidisphaera sp.]
MQAALDRHRPGAPRTLLRTLAACEGPTYAASGLPVRVVHKASGVKLRLVPAGAFVAGGTGDASDKLPRRVVIHQPFYLGETEVTIAQFRAFVDATGYTTDAERGTAEEPDKTIGAFTQTAKFHQRHWNKDAHWRRPFPFLTNHILSDDHPVSQISWNDAMAFCEHYGLALPEPSQWEYAARAGGRFGGGNFADASTGRLFNEDFGTPDDGFPTHAIVASFEPNGFGLYDLLGNVQEWTADSSSITSLRDGEMRGLARPRGREARIAPLRGSTWFDLPPLPDDFGCASDFSMPSHCRRDFIGFRVIVPME